jgi:hypothetical protein
MLKWGRRGGVKGVKGYVAAYYGEVSGCVDKLCP